MLVCSKLGFGSQVTNDCILYIQEVSSTEWPLRIFIFKYKIIRFDGFSAYCETLSSCVNISVRLWLLVNNELKWSLWLS